MTPGEIIVLLALAAVTGLAVRRMWRSRGADEHCSGDCGRCGGCHRSAMGNRPPDFWAAGFSCENCVKIETRPLTYSAGFRYK